MRIYKTRSLPDFTRRAYGFFCTVQINRYENNREEQNKIKIFLTSPATRHRISLVKVGGGCQ